MPRVDERPQTPLAAARQNPPVRLPPYPHWFRTTGRRTCRGRAGALKEQQNTHFWSKMHCRPTIHRIQRLELFEFTSLSLQVSAFADTHPQPSLFLPGLLTCPYSVNLFQLCLPKDWRASFHPVGPGRRQAVSMRMLTPPRDRVVSSHRPSARIGGYETMLLPSPPPRTPPFTQYKSSGTDEYGVLTLTCCHYYCFPAFVSGTNFPFWPPTARVQPVQSRLVGG